MNRFRNYPLAAAGFVIPCFVAIALTIGTLLLAPMEVEGQSQSGAQVSAGLNTRDRREKRQEKFLLDHIDSTGLVQQSDLAIVRFDIDLVERYHGHQRRTGADVVADLYGPLAHHAVDRCPNLCIGQIKPGLFKLSLIGLDRRFRRRSLGLEHVQLPTCRIERSLSAVQRGLTLLKRGVGSLVFLHCAGSRRGEVAEAARVGLRESEPGARRSNGGLLFFYDRGLA